MGTFKPTVDPKYEAMMKEIATIIDQGFNPGLPLKKRTTGFALLVFPLGEEPKGRINYISNSVRADMIKAMEEFLARAKGEHPEEKT